MIFSIVLAAFMTFTAVDDASSNDEKITELGQALVYSEKCRTLQVDLDVLVDLLKVVGKSPDYSAHLTQARKAAAEGLKGQNLSELCDQAAIDFGLSGKKISGLLIPRK